MTKRNKSLFPNASHFLLQISSVLIRNVTASTKMQLFHCKKKKKKKRKKKRGLLQNVAEILQSSYIIPSPCATYLFHEH